MTDVGGLQSIVKRTTARTQAQGKQLRLVIGQILQFCSTCMKGKPMSLLVVVRCAGSPVWSQLGWGKLLAKVASVVLWTSGTMSRQEKQKATRSFFTFRFRMKHRVRGSRRNCQGSSKTSTENCAGNIKRVSGFIGPPRSAKLAALWLALNSNKIQNKEFLILSFS